MPKQPEESGAPWTVKVSRKKKTSNKKTGVRKKGHIQQSFAGMLTVDGDDAICMAGQRWKRIELTVDSSAAENICQTTMATTMP